jgi:hypothetical protein
MEIQPLKQKSSPMKSALEAKNADPEIDMVTDKAHGRHSFGPIVL